jgi:demethylmenaquinone methyltransferase/2-methoxy-6-polyprenyl-1,4-benzoquinol methylase
MNHKIATSLDISRVFTSKRDAQVTYDRISSWYDILAGSEHFFTDAGIDKLNPVVGENILEIGYGTGRAVVKFARAVGDSGNVYGIDISEGMHTVAQRRVDRERMSFRVTLGCGDAAALPFGSGFFNAIFMSFTLELFDTPEIPLVLKECHRVITPAGRICVVALAKEEYEGLMLRSYEWMHRRFPKVVDCRPINVQSSLHAVGFRILDTSRKYMWGLPVDICLADKKLVEGKV